MLRTSDSTNTQPRKSSKTTASTTSAHVARGRSAPGIADATADETLVAAVQQQPGSKSMSHCGKGVAPAVTRTAPPATAAEATRTAPTAAAAVTHTALPTAAVTRTTTSSSGAAMPNQAWRRPRSMR